MRVVVVGCGHAGFTAVTALRERGYAGAVTVVLGGNRLPYQRPPLSKAHLKDPVLPEELAFRPREHYERHDIALATGPATGVDRERHVVTLGGAPPLPYEQLVLATGSFPRRLGVPGEDLAGVQHLHDADDADALVARLVHLGGEGRLVVVGAGFIGLEVAAGARARGLDVTVLARGDAVLRRSTSPGVGAHLLTAHRAAGTRVLEGVSVDRLLGGDDGAVRAVLTTGGEEVPADLVVTGVGAAPSTALAEEAGLCVDDGIVVDEHLVSVSDPAVSAIGDCCRPRDGRGARLESVQNAVDQARYVADRLATAPVGRAPYAALPWFWTDQLGLKVQIAGLVSTADTHVTVGDPERDKFSVLGFRGGRLVAVESVNQPADHLAARRLLADARHDLAGIAPGEVGPDFSLRSLARTLCSSPSG